MKNPTPIVFISYAREDEPEQREEGKVQWLSFVREYLQPAEEEGAIEIWTDQLMPGGANWEPEIQHKLRACDVFILLVSRYSLASKYISRVEIANIRKRQADGEDVHFYPLLLTSTPKIALAKVQDKNLRPHGGEPFSSYPANQRERHMSEAADEIVKIAAEIAERKRAKQSALPPQKQTAPAHAEPVSAVSPADVAGLGHPRSQKKDRGALHPCMFHIMSPHFLRKGRWERLGDVLVDIKDELPDEDWTREAYLIPSKNALPKLRDPDLLKADGSHYLRLKKDATRKFVEAWQHRELAGAWFKMPTRHGHSVGVYSKDYDQFLNASLAKEEGLR